MCTLSLQFLLFSLTYLTQGDTISAHAPTTKTEWSYKPLRTRKVYSHLGFVAYTDSYSFYFIYACMHIQLSDPFGCLVKQNEYKLSMQSKIYVGNTGNRTRDNWLSKCILSKRSTIWAIPWINVVMYQRTQLPPPGIINCYSFENSLLFSGEYVVCEQFPFLCKQAFFMCLSGTNSVAIIGVYVNWQEDSSNGGPNLWA